LETGAFERLSFDDIAWAWIGGLFDVLLPAWHHGIPVLAYRYACTDGLAMSDSSPE
jgi:acetyl-CoA synthetase